LGYNRIELAGFAARKAPEIIESERVRPAIKRHRGSLLRIRLRMPFSDCSVVVAVELKSLCDGCGPRRPVRAVTRPTARQFTNRPESHGMMISSRQQSRARRRTKCWYVETIVAKSSGREFVECRSSDGPAERGRISEPSIID